MCKKQRVLRFSASLEETTAPGMDSKQPQVTSDEPAVNISGKLSSSTSIYTLYYLYIYYIYIYIFTHASTYTTCTLPRQSTLSKGAGRANNSRHGTTFLHRRGTNLLPSVLVFLAVCPFSRSRNTAHSLQKGTRNKTGHKSCGFLFFFLFSFSTSRESFVGKRTQYTHTKRRPN